MSGPEAQVISFLIRLVRAQGGDPSDAWRDLVRHVQSGQELHFRRLEEAVTFMERFLQDRGGNRRFVKRG